MELAKPLGDGLQQALVAGMNVRLRWLAGHLEWGLGFRSLGYGSQRDPGNFSENSMNNAADHLGDCSGIQDHTCRNGRRKICRHRVSGLWHPRQKLWEGLQRWGKRHSHSEYLRLCIQCIRCHGNLLYPT